MSATHYIQTILEILLIVAVLVALMYEPTIAKWEKRQCWKVCKALKQRKGYRK